MSSPEPIQPETRRRHPYFTLGFSILMAAAAQLLMKLGADEAVGTGQIFGFSGLRSGWMWLGIGAHIASLLCWLSALRSTPLNVAFNFTGFIPALIALASWVFLGEQLGWQRWLGTLLICAGVIITAREAGRVEEKL